MDGQLRLVPEEDSTTERSASNPARPRARRSRLSATTIENGRKGVAMARASLEASRRRRLEEEARAERRRGGSHAA